VRSLTGHMLPLPGRGFTRYTPRVRCTGPLVNGEDDCVAFIEWHPFRPWLHTRALLGQYELASVKVKG
jgi:hypothetical protein